MKRPVFIASILLLLAFLFGWETRQAWLAVPGGTDNTAAAPRDLWQPGAATPDPAPPADTGPIVAAIAARPLFRADRQPYRESAVAAAAARNYESELARFTLLGVLGIGDTLTGLVVSKAGTRTDRWELKAGDALPGFTVKAVRADGMAVMADGREFLLPLYAGAPTAAAGALRTETHRRDAPPPASPVAHPAPSVPSPAPSAPAVSGQATVLPSRVAPPPRNVPYRSAPMGNPRFLPARR